MFENLEYRGDLKTVYIHFIIFDCLLLQITRNPVLSVSEIKEEIFILSILFNFTELFLIKKFLTIDNQYYSSFRCIVVRLFI